MCCRRASSASATSGCSRRAVAPPISRRVAGSWPSRLRSGDIGAVQWANRLESIGDDCRFAYASRGEGQLQAPALAQWNGRVGRWFALGTRRFEIALSLLNITNRAVLQEPLGGNNQIGSPNFAYGPDGTFRGQNRQAARTAQLSLQFEF